MRDAVANLMECGTEDYAVRGLVARAEFFRRCSDTVQAKRHLDDAERFATRTGMMLHLADVYLEAARLALARGEESRAKTLVNDVRSRIAKMGYHRRDRDVDELEQALCP